MQKGKRHGQPINLHKITNLNSPQFINENFRKIQQELAGVKTVVGEKADRGNWVYEQYDRYIGPYPPASRRDVHEYAQKKFYRGKTPPENPEIGDVWLDENTSPPILRTWNGEEWTKVTRSDFADLDGLVQSLQIADQAVTSAKIAVGAIETQHIQDLAVTDTKLAAGAIRESKMNWQTHLIF